MSTHDPFDGEFFVGASICGLGCMYTVRRLMMSNRPDGWSVWTEFRGSAAVRMGTGFTWIEAMRFVVERVEAEVAPEEGREVEAL